MPLFYPNLGTQQQCKDVPLTFPAQHQEVQPGLEAPMQPPPIFDNPNYAGTGKLKDRVALVSGGDSGIGRAVCLAFAKEGANIVILYYNEHEDANAIKAQIEALGRRCLLCSGDIGSEALCAKVIADTIAAFGRLDVLVNNAGCQFPQNGLLDIPAEQLDRTFRVNVYGMFYLTRAALPHLKAGATIINTTSITAYAGNETLIDYSSTKGAIVSFTRSMALSLVAQGIRVNAVAPGPIWTPLQPASWPAEHIRTFGASTPMKRAGQPVELAPTYVYLASEDSSYVTGQVLHVDGGASTQS